MLLHSGTPSRSDTPPPELPPATLQITITGLKMLNYMAVLNLDMLQVRKNHQLWHIEEDLIQYTANFQSFHYCKNRIGIANIKTFNYIALIVCCID